MLRCLPAPHSVSTHLTIRPCTAKTSQNMRTMTMVVRADSKFNSKSKSSPKPAPVVELSSLSSEGRYGIPLPEARTEEWEQARKEETAELERQRRLEAEVEAEKEEQYRNIGQQLKDYPAEDVKNARKLVASLIKAGEEMEEVIEQAAQNGELTPLVLVVIRNRLELARHDHLFKSENLSLIIKLGGLKDERDAIQALDLLYRRIEMEILRSEASLAMQLLNELLNLHDGFSHEEWLRRSRRTMIEVFPPEDAFTILGAAGVDMENQMGPIEIPEEDDALLRIDFIREVDELLKELESQAGIKPVSGLDPQSVAVRLRQQEKLRAIQQVKDLRHLAATLQW